MFPPRVRQQGPFNGNSGMGFNPMGFNPFEHHNQYIQEDNPFRRDFFMPQQPPQSQQIQGQGQMPQSQHFQGQGQNPQVQPFQGQGQMPQGLNSLFRDQNGNVDLMKIGNNVQNVMGVVNQVGPIMKMFNGFFR
ncbi:YppG family protein [Bacillus sp. FJAT-45350]|uniref:YppG family protein n=1 Tax=Bacillus sp. FJAT-45350 TaxID=2011014 RepID=UPI000BB75D8A|nr:YppG family protein [Bacillus sp. FJAT-45350]